VLGEFDAGDAVDVAHDGRRVGKGICNYSAVELRASAGLKSAAVRELLPRASRGGGAPRLPRARLAPDPTGGDAAHCACGSRNLLMAWRPHRSVADICARGQARVARARALDTATRTRRSRRSPRRSRPRERDPRGERARHEAGREAGAQRGADRPAALDERRIAAIAAACAAIAALPDPVGEVIDGQRLPRTASTCARCGCRSGVVAVVYEARPNVTIDAAALCLKSGNAIVLRGSSSAAHSNAALARSPRGGRGGRAAGGLRSSLVAGGGREELAELATQTGVVDLIIPRGGRGLKARSPSTRPCP
jgi:hypothetical protein